MSNTTNQSRRRRSPAARPVVSRAQRMRRRWAKQIRDAAEMILTGKKVLACNALTDAFDDLKAWVAVRWVFHTLFRPDGALFMWWGSGEVEPRVTALLLLAEIVEGATDEEWVKLCGSGALASGKEGAR